MRLCLPFWHNKKSPEKEELTSDELHKLLINSDFCSPNSRLHPYLNSEQFVFEHTFTSGKFTLWHVLASIKRPEHIKLLKDLLNKYNNKITPEHLNRPAANGLTPCHAAAYEGNVEALRLLVEYGADPTISSLQGEQDTPLYHAETYRYNDRDLPEIKQIIANYLQIYQAAAEKRTTAEQSTTVRERHPYLSRKPAEKADIELVTTPLLTSINPSTSSTTNKKHVL